MVCLAGGSVVGVVLVAVGSVVAVDSGVLVAVGSVVAVGWVVAVGATSTIVNVTSTGVPAVPPALLAE